MDPEQEICSHLSSQLVPTWRESCSLQLKNFPQCFTWWLNTLALLLGMRPNYKGSVYISEKQKIPHLGSLSFIHSIPSFYSLRHLFCMRKHYTQLWEILSVMLTFWAVLFVWIRSGSSAFSIWHQIYRLYQILLVFYALSATDDFLEICIIVL